MDESWKKTSIGTWIVIILLIIGIALVLAAIGKSHQQNQQTTQTTQTEAPSNNLALQNECISNAQSSDMTNPVYYSTIQIGDEPPGLTLTGQEELQTQTANCKAQYPTN